MRAVDLADLVHARTWRRSAREAGTTGRWTVVPMSQVVAFLRTCIREHWAVLHHAQIKDPAMGVLALLEKWGNGQANA